MGDKTIDTLEVLKATRIDGDRFNRLVDDAEAAFWERLTADVPEARSGDLPPDADEAFARACRQAASAWLIANVHPALTTGAVAMTVELRAPRVGERGWWVTDDSSPHAALREVLRECAEFPPGFEVREGDEIGGTPYDEEGMRLVTVIATEVLTPVQAWDKLKDLP